MDKAHVARLFQNRYSETKILVVVALAGLTGSGCMASIRPATIAEDALAPADVTKGRALLAEAAKNHGVDAWRRAETLSFEMTDSWQGLLGWVGNPWPDSEVHAKVAYRVGTFDARATFLSGDDAGTTWGMQSWKTYVERDGNATFEEDDDIAFILPAEQYLLEFPMRAQNIELVSWGGSTIIEGVEYDLVFATWGSPEANGDHDQYVAYINRETKMIEKVEYTIREFAGFATGTIHYSEFRDFDGIKIPTVQVISGSPEDPLEEDGIHTIKIDPATVRVNGVAPGAFAVDPTLPVVGDEKPPA